VRGTQKRESSSPQSPPQPVERKKPREATPRQQIPQVNVEPTVELKPESMPLPKPKPKPRTRTKLEPKPEPKPEPKLESQPEPQPEPKLELQLDPQPEPKLDEPEVTLHDSARETTVIFTQGPKRTEPAMPPRIEARKPFSQMWELGSLSHWLHRAWPFLGLLLVFLVTVVSVSAWLSRSESNALPARKVILAPTPTPAHVPATSPATTTAPSPDLTAKLPVAPIPVPAHVEPAKPPVMPPTARSDAKPAPRASPNGSEAKPASPVVRKAPVQTQERRKPPPATNSNCRNPNVSERSVECLFSK
jgi:hypothetical protein